MGKTGGKRGGVVYVKIKERNKCRDRCLTRTFTSIMCKRVWDLLPLGAGVTTMGVLTEANILDDRLHKDRVKNFLDQRVVGCEAYKSTKIDYFDENSDPINLHLSKVQSEEFKSNYIKPPPTKKRGRPLGSKNKPGACRKNQKQNSCENVESQNSANELAAFEEILKTQDRDVLFSVCVLCLRYAQFDLVKQIGALVGSSMALASRFGEEDNYEITS